MKRVIVLPILAVLAFGLAGYGLPRAAIWREQQFRQRQQEAQFGAVTRLVLDATTQAILTGADRVETFRLDDFHEGEQRTGAELEAISKIDLGSLDAHRILRVGVPQGKAFAGELHTALSQMNSPSLMASCFDPGVGFRVWKGRAHTDLCVCFYCSGVEIVTTDARHKIVYQKQSVLGPSRATFLALARQAFPQDAPLSALKG